MQEHRNLLTICVMGKSKFDFGDKLAGPAAKKTVEKPQEQTFHSGIRQ